MITLYTGEFLIHPVPLELSLHRCTYGCAYCFATLNYRHSGYTDCNVSGVMKLLQEYPQRKTLVARLLQEKYPVLISNHSDPFAPVNGSFILPILETLTALDIPVAMQTRGGKHVRDALSILKPSCWYISITSDRDQPSLEPGTPPLTDRLALIDELVKRGHSVSVGINPYVPEWWTDAPGLLKELKARGVHGVCSQLLHLHYRQRDHLTDKERAALGEPLITAAMKRTPFPETIAAFEAFNAQVQATGLELYTGDHNHVSAFFDPYKAIYPKYFPYFQEFVNHCARLQRDPLKLVTFDEFWAWASPLLPSGIYGEMSKYIGCIAHDFFWEKRVPAKMSYKSLLRTFWEHPEIGKHPALTGTFTFPGRWDVEEPPGWIQYVTQDRARVVSFQAAGNAPYIQEMPKAALSY